MYYVCKFSGTWSAFDAKTRQSKLLAPDDIETIQGLFGPALHPEAILDAIMVSIIPAHKLPPADKAVAPGLPTIFYICHFSTAWFLYDSTEKTDRTLTPAEIHMITTVFTTVINKSAVVLTLMITPISPNKLQQLTSRQPFVPEKKSGSVVKKTFVAEVVK